MFTQSCFINKNSRDLRYMLGCIGYKPRGKNKDFPYIYCHRGVYSTPSTNEKPPKDCYIDCGTNEELFSAIAALRDDSDKYQWFKSNNANCWVQCMSDRFAFYTYIESDGEYTEVNIADSFHKAIVEELIEHFKDKQLCTE